MKVVINDMENVNSLFSYEGCISCFGGSRDSDLFLSFNQ